MLFAMARLVRSDQGHGKTVYQMLLAEKIIISPINVFDVIRQDFLYFCRDVEMAFVECIG